MPLEKYVGKLKFFYSDTKFIEDPIWIAWRKKIKSPLMVLRIFIFIYVNLGCIKVDAR